ncbi:MAG: filamentous hemagglutinin N-terminal domain-containing protein [Hahellaceae bacterium]|nr:filamentous hemagglutinin N-terminal domain-containing protein [Hahellaceae bacterium]MCP5169670.1 filamentous hemagglutinin N-terminal domain-containing protein [Hahellaceae bacterium]
MSIRQNISNPCSGVVPHHLRRHPLRGISLALLAFPIQAWVNPAQANPTGASVVNGSVSLDTSVPGVLNITNSPNAIINWQNFSIAPNEITRFIQQYGSSAILNRVTGQNPSQVLGQLLSNGRVFLINPNGIVFGQGARVDTQGLVASTLNLSDRDFLSGNYHFTAGSTAGRLENQGLIHAGRDGSVVLIAPTIENSGVINTENGKIVLAAGQSLTITSLDDPSIRYEVSAPSDDILNIGELLTQGGAVDLFANSIRQEGVISANGIEVDAQGNIRLVARETLTLGENSRLDVSHQQAGAGSITLDTLTGTTWVKGALSADAHAGTGGTIDVLGERVALVNADVSASGTLHGGNIRIGGDLRGSNPDIHSADAVYVGADVSVHADATQAGDGGRVIIWSDASTRMKGTVTANAAGTQGDGGFIETSGGYLELGEVVPEARAAGGKSGTWLIDPEDVEITTLDNNILQAPTAGQITFYPDQPNQVTTLNVANIITALNAGTDVYVTTMDSQGVATESGNITVNAPITKTNDPGSTPLLFLEAHNDIYVNKDITSSAGAMNISLVADFDSSGAGESVISATISPNGGVIATDDGRGSGSGKVRVIANATVNGKLNAQTVTVDSGTATLNDSLITNSLVLNGGTLNGSGNISLATTFLWNGGTLGGSGTLTTSSNSTSTISGDVVTLADSRIWNNEGVVNWNGNGGAFDTFALNGTSRMENSFLGSFYDNTSATTYAQIGASATAVFNNTGFYSKTGSTTTRVAFTPFNNTSGTVDLSAGLLQLSSGGTDSGSYNLNGGSLMLSGGTRLFNDVVMSGSSSFEVAGATLDTSGSDGIFRTLNFIFSSGTLMGNIDVLSGDTFTWSGGTIRGAGIVNLAFGGVANLPGDTLILDDSVALNVSGTLNWIGNGGAFDSFNLNGTSAINILAGGLFSDQTTATTYAQLGNAAGAVISNAGKLTKSATSNTRIVSTPFNNSGTVQVASGLLELRTNGTDTGLFDLVGGELSLVSGTRLFSGSVTGSSAFNVSGGTLDLQSGAVFSALLTQFSSGTITGVGDWAVRSGDVFNWSGGSFGGSGLMNIAAGGVLNLNGDILTLNDSRVWNNSGTVNWSGNGGAFDSLNLNNSVIFNNLAGGVFNDSTFATTFAQLGSSASAAFNNAGAFNKSGSGVTRLQATSVTQTGSVALTAGTLEFHNSGVDSGTYLLNGGEVSLVSGTRFFSGSVSGASAFNISGATLDIQSGATFSALLANLNSGSVIGAGDWTVRSGDVFNWNGSSFGGSGFTTIASGGIVNLNGDSLAMNDSRIWNNSGTVNWNGNGGAFDTLSLNSSVAFNNLAGGVFNDNTFATSFAQLGNSSLAAFNNLGKFNKTGSGITHLTTTPFNQSGTVTLTNGSLELRNSDSDTGLYELNGGELSLVSGTRLFSGTVTGTSAFNLAGGTLDIQSGFTFSTLLANLNTGTVTGGGDWTVRSGDVLNWNGGSVGGSGVTSINTGGQVNLNGDALPFNDSRIWNNSGMVNWNGNGGAFDTLGLNSTMVFNNLFGGVFNDNTVATSFAQLGNSGTAAFNNQGQFNKTGTSITHLATTPFNQSGTVTVTGGTLELRNSGIDTGQYVLNGGELSLVSGTRLFSSLVTGPSAFNLAGGTLDIQSGFTFSTQLANLNTGTVTGAGDWTVRSGDVLNWSGGSVGGTGVTTINTGGQVNLNGDALPFNDSRIWNNSGMVNWNGNGGAFDTLTLNSTAVFNNLASGVFFDKTAATSYAEINGASLSQFNNAGLWSKTGATVTRFSSVPWTNSGAFGFDAGSVEMSSALNDTNGVFNLNGGMFIHTGGNWGLNGSQFNGISLLKLNSGTVSIPSLSTVNIAPLEMNGGTLTNDGVLNLSSGGNFLYNGGTLAGNGVFTAQNGHTTMVAADLFQLSGTATWNNSGVFIWAGNGGTSDTFALSGSAVFNNLINGVFQDNTITTANALINGSASAQFNNQGTYEKTGNAVTLWDVTPVTNAGSLNINAGSLLGNSPFTQMAGQVNVASGATVSLSNSTFTGGELYIHGSWDLSSGSLLIWSGGAVRGTGTLNSLSGATVNITGDLVGVADTLTWNNSGTVNFNGTGVNTTLFLNDNSVLNNLASGVFNDNTSATDAVIGGAVGSSLFSNTGTFNKNGSNITHITSLFENAGIVNLNGGAVFLENTGVQSGSFNLASGSLLKLLGFGWDFASGSQLNGTGTAEFVGTANFMAGAVYALTGKTWINEGQLALDTGSLVALSDLEISGGVLTGTDAIQINAGGTFRFSGGMLGGSGDFNTLSTSVSNIDGASVELAGSRVWNNSGNLNWTGNGSVTQFILSDTSVFNNLPTGLFNDNTVASDALLIDPGTLAVFNNQGGFNKNSGNNTFVNVMFNNSGVVNTDIGMLTLLANGSDTGTYNLSVNSTLGVAGTSRLFLSGSQIAGAGDFVVDGVAAFQSGAGYSVSGRTVVNSGQLNFDTGALVSMPTLQLVSGLLTGTDDIQIDAGGTFLFQGGTLGGSGAFNTPASVFSQIDGSLVELSGTRVWNNGGVLDWNGIGTSQDSFRLIGTSTFNNLAGGIFNDKTAAAVSALLGSDLPTESSFNNDGQFIKVGSSLTAITNIAFNNRGNVEVNGQLSLFQTVGSHTGIYQLNSGSLTQFSTSAHQFLSGSQVTGTGDMVTGLDSQVVFENGSIYSLSGQTLVQGGLLDFSTGSTLVLPSLYLNGGSLIGSDRIDIPANGQFLFDAGVLGGSGSLNTSAGSVSLLNGDSIALADSRVWNNQGTVNWLGDGGVSDSFQINGTARFQNMGGGVFNDATLVTGSAGLTGSTTAAFLNDGQFNKMGASTTQISGVPFTQNGGSLNVASGATLDFQSESRLGHSGNLTGAGNIRFGTNVFFDVVVPNPIKSAQTVTLDNGPIQLAGVITPPSHGTLTINSDGSVTYTPELGFTGNDSFALDIRDSFGNSARSSAVSFTVQNDSFAWAGGTTGSWNNPANWGGAVPTPGSDVVISGAAGSVTIVFDDTVGSLFLNSLQSNANISLTGGSLTLGNSLTDTSVFAPGTALTLAGGSFGGNGTIKVQGEFNWSAGVMNGAGVLDLNQATQVQISGNGTVTPILNGMTIKANTLNVAGSVFTLQQGALQTQQLTVAGGSSFAMNGGTLDTVSLNLDGNMGLFNGGVTLDSLTITPQGTLALSAGQVTVASANGTVTNQGGIFKTDSASVVTLNTPQFVNTGTVQVSGGVLDLGNRYQQTGGQTILSGGELKAGSFDFNSGALKGSGTFTGNFNNNGLILSPGNSPGSITVNGDYHQGAGANLTMEIAGTQTGQFDQLKVNGTAYLGGTLTIVPLSPYAETPTGELVSLIISNAVNGNFTGTTVPAGYTFTPSLATTGLQGSLKKTVLSTPPLTQQKANNLQETQIVNLSGQFVPLAVSTVKETEEEKKKQTSTTTENKVTAEVIGSTKAEVCQ